MPEVDRRKTGTKPAYSEGKIAIWPRETPSGVAIWNIREEQGSGPVVTACFAEVNGYEMVAEEAAALYRGDDVIATMRAKESGKEYDASLFNAGVKTDSKTVGEKTYDNRTLQVGMGIRVHNAEGRHTGYLIDSVGFPVYLKGGAQLEAGECWKLLKGETIEKDNYQLKLDEVKEVSKEGRVFKNAEVSVKILGESERPAVEEMKTDDGLTVRTFRSAPRGDETEGMVTGFRITEGDDSAREGVSFKARGDNYTLNQDDALALFRGETLKGEIFEIKMTGVVEVPSPRDATRTFKNGELEVVKIQQAEEEAEHEDETPRMKV